MTGVALVVAVVVALVGLGAVVSTPRAWAWSAGRRRKGAPQVGEPRSLVRVLRDGDELEEAVERARRYDEEAEATLRERIERYRATAPRTNGAVVALRPGEGGAGDGDRDGHLTA